MPNPQNTILIIENDIPTLELYCQALGTGFHTIGTLNAAEALELARQNSIQAIILEPGMNQQHGWDLVAELRQVLQPTPPPIILCSWLDERRRGRELNVAAYLVKPVMPAELNEVLHQILALPPKKRVLIQG
jgi:DNA-binding response OmpR family regulator